MYYKSQTWLTGKKGNNAISFEIRKKLGSSLRLSIPKVIGGSLNDVTKQGNEDYIAFEEAFGQFVGERSKIVKSYGLENLVVIERFGKKICIMDNHNHAFYFWGKAFLEGEIEKSLPVIHIDQHSDLAVPEQFLENDKSLDIDQISIYTNETLEVGSFIKAAQYCNLIGQDIQVRSEFSLLDFDFKKINSDVLLDIDLDFRADEMGIECFDETIEQTQNLISHPHVKLVTIATSPYFLKQDWAIKLLHKLLG